MGKEVSRCPLCWSTAEILWAEQRFWACQVCGLRFRHPMPKLAELEALYAASWSDPQMHPSETGDTQHRLAHLYSGKLARAARIGSFSGLTILDFGAGTGEMAKVLQGMGAHVYCVDPFGYEILQQRGLEAYRTLGELGSVRFDGVVTIQVVEHLPTPWVDLQALRSLLRPRGWLYVATPNARGLAARWHGGQWREARKPGHVVLFTPRSLERALQQADFARVQRLRWYVRYRHEMYRQLIHLGLQAFRWDGDLRYLAWT